MSSASTSRNAFKEAQQEGTADVMDVDEKVNGDVEGEEEHPEQEDEDDEEEEGEYEVEAIVDHKAKKGGQTGKFDYLVSWKGYGPEHNTWEPEEHVSHASGIVSRYWAGKPKPSLANDKKRGRPSGAGSSTPTPASQRKTTRTNGTAGGSAAGGRRRPAAVDRDDEEDIPDFDDTHIDSTEKYENVAVWDDRVQSIDTIERSRQDELTVYITMIGGEKIALPTEVAYKRCPQRILKFYEKHLKWKAT